MKEILVLGEFIRNGAFRLFDFINGNKIRKQIDEIQLINEQYDSEQAKNRINESLSRLLKHAVDTTKFYRGLSKNLLITDFPVINKNIIRERIDDFISDKYNKDELIPVVTSGSTGTPFMVYHDNVKRSRNTADTLYFGQKAGFKPGQRLFYFKIWNEINKKSKIDAWIQNIKPVNVVELSDEAIASLIKTIKSDKSTKSFLGYSSAYDAICRYMSSQSIPAIQANIKSIVSMSESLNEFTKTSMSKYFNVPVVSRYSNVENGMIAQQERYQSNDFFINHASYFIEVLDLDNDTPSGCGVPGRIVITDFYNYGMPLIRYDTGDIGTLIKGSGKHEGVPVLSRIEGRRMDQVFNTKGELVSSFTITNNMWKYLEIRQYQFIQISDKEYLFKLNVDSAFNRKDELINEFKGYFGNDATITLEYVNEVPLLSSGKRKKVVNSCPRN